MEMKQLKEFGKEVGLKPLAMGKMDEDTLIVEVLKAVDPKNEYSQEFIAWYENLDDGYFDAAETTDIESGADAASETAGDDFSELIEVINESTKVADLKEIATDADFAHLFESINLSKYRAAKTLKVAMLACLEPSDESADVDIDEDTKAELVEMINSIESEDELIEFVSDETIESIFGDKLEIGDEIDLDGLKGQMLSIIGVEAEEKPAKPMTLKEKMAAKKAQKAGGKAKKTAPKKKAAPKAKPDDSLVIDFDPNDFDPEEVYAATEELGIPQLRKFAKQLEVTAPPGSKKVDILGLVADKLQELAEGGGATSESTGDGEVTVNQSMVNDAIAADDRESLQAMCEEFGIKLNALQKKSTKLMGNKLLEVVPADEPAKRDAPKSKLASKLKGKDKSAPASETESIYQTIESMVLNGDDESAITAVVKPLYVAKGKTLLFIKKRVKQMVEIVKGDNDLE